MTILQLQSNFKAIGIRAVVVLRHWAVQRERPAKNRCCGLSFNVLLMLIFLYIVKEFLVYFQNMLCMLLKHY
jgi:hypothetical protein